jgi:hypothetical protein
MADEKNGFSLDLRGVAHSTLEAQGALQRIDKRNKGVRFI